MLFIILLILTAVLFILYKVVTDSTIPSIKLSINNRKNSDSIKNSYNTTTTINNSTHTTNNFNNNYSSNDSSGDLGFLPLLFGTITIGVIVTNFYKSNIDKINLVLFFSVLAIAIIYLVIGFYYNFKGKLTKEFIIYLVISFLALLVVIYFFFYPKYIPDSVKDVLSSSEPINANSLKSDTATFIIFKLIGGFGQVVITLISLVQILRRYSFDQIKASFIFMTFISILFFFATSGLFSKLISLY